MNETQVSIKFKNSVTGQTKLDKYKESLQQIYSFLSSIDVNKSKEVDKIAKNTKQTKDDSKQMAKNFNLAFNVSAIKSFANQFERIVTSSTKFIKQSAEYTENLNLLSVAFRQTGVNVEETTNEAMKFVNTLSQMYGLDESKLIRTTGLFKQMANSLGITNEAGTKLSQTLTQLSIDAASLFNAEEIEDAAKVFQSALASQTKPIRGFTGADITQQTLQVTLDTYGIDEAITDLSYAEKRLVIVASLVDQLDEAIGDFGRTIESPANQMKIFTEQVHRLGRAIGNVLMPVFYKILPYMNAFLMVLVEITNYLATFIGNLFGYNFDDYNPFTGIDDSITNLEEDMASAGEQAKKLKSGLRGFDKLNVISSSKDKDSSSGVGGVDNAYYDLLNQAVDKYNSKLQTTQMLATKIRDNILQWLGFTVQTDEETGKLNLKFEKITSGTVLGGLAVGGIIYSGVSKVVKLLSKLGVLKFPGVAALGKALKGIPTLFAKLGGAIKAVVVGIASATGLSVGWVVAIGVAIATVIALIVVFWDEIKGFFIKIGNAFNEYVIQPIVEFITNLATNVYDNVIKPIIDFFKPIVEAIVEISSLVIEKIAEIASGIGKAIWEIMKKIGEIFAKIIEIFIAIGKAVYEYVIKPIFEFIGNVFSKIYEKVIKPIVDLFKKVGSWFYDNIIKPIFDKVVWLKDKAVEIFKNIGITVVDFISTAFKTVINGVLAMIENTINVFIKGLNGVIGLLNKVPGVDITKVNLLSIPRLQKGLDFVPSDYYPAYLDYGERVLTKQENQDYNRGIIRGENAIGGQPINATFVIQVGDKEIAKTVLNDLQNMAKSNGQPIKIG